MTSTVSNRVLRICSFYALACLTKDEIVHIAARLTAIENVQISDLYEQAYQSERIVPPQEVASAGRARIAAIAGRPYGASLIFSVSVPFDVMANIDVNRTCPEVDCLRCIQEVVETARAELGDLIARYDAECVTVVSETPLSAAFTASAVNLGLKELHSSGTLVVYSAPYPYDCILIIGASDGVVTEAQTALQNLYRIRGGAHHLNRALNGHLRQTIGPLRDAIGQYSQKSGMLNTRQKLRAIRPMREDLFRLQAAHAELMMEFANLLEYETLYLNISSLAVPHIPALVEEIQSDYLEPLKLLRGRTELLFQSASAYLDTTVTAVYADVNLDLGQKMQKLTYMQAAIGFILFALTIVEVLSLFIKVGR